MADESILMNDNEEEETENATRGVSQEGLEPGQRRVRTAGTVKTANSPNKGENIEVIGVYYLGSNLTDAIAVHGEDAVFQAYRRAADVQYQGRVRSLIERGFSPKEILGLVADFHPGSSNTRTVNPVAAFAAMYHTASEDEQAALREQLAAILSPVR